MSENVAKITEKRMEIVKLAGPGSRTAMSSAGIRYEESLKPEGERICYDPYGVHFIKDSLEWAARNPEKMKVMKEVLEHSLPGYSNSIIARVR